MELDGKYRDSKKYFCRDHLFYKKPNHCCKRETWVCSYSKDSLYKCKVNIVRKDGGKLILSKLCHEHPASPHMLPVSKMIQDIKEAAKYPGTAHMIYDRLVPK